MFSQKLIIIDVRSTVLSFYLTDAIKDLRHLVYRRMGGRNRDHRWICLDGLAGVKSSRFLTVSNKQSS